MSKALGEEVGSLEAVFALRQLIRDLGITKLETFSSAGDYKERNAEYAKILNGMNCGLESS